MQGTGKITEMFEKEIAALGYQVVYEDFAGDRRGSLANVVAYPYNAELLAQNTQLNVIASPLASQENIFPNQNYQLDYKMAITYSESDIHANTFTMQVNKGEIRELLCYSDDFVCELPRFRDIKKIFEQALPELCIPASLHKSENKPVVYDYSACTIGSALLHLNQFDQMIVAKGFAPLFDKSDRHMQFNLNRFLEETGKHCIHEEKSTQNHPLPINPPSQIYGDFTYCFNLKYNPVDGFEMAQIQISHMTEEGRVRSFSCRPQSKGDIMGREYLTAMMGKAMQQNKKRKIGKHL